MTLRRVAYERLHEALGFEFAHAGALLPRSAALVGLALQLEGTNMKIHNALILTNAKTIMEMDVSEQSNFTGNSVYSVEDFTARYITPAHAELLAAANDALKCLDNIVPYERNIKERLEAAIRKAEESAP